MSARPGQLLAKNGNLPYLQFYLVDHCTDPALSVCSLAARGLHDIILMMMHRGNPFGHLADNGAPVPLRAIARAAGTTEKTVKKLLDELVSAGVYSKNSENFLFSRRLVRDRKKLECSVSDGLRAQKKRENIKGFENPQNDEAKSGVDPTVDRGVNRGVNPDADADADADKEDSPPIPPAAPAPETGTPSAPEGERSSISEPDGFSAFWDAYPDEYRDSPDEARQAYAKALKGGATPPKIMAALGRSIDQARACKRAMKVPSAWLNGGSWRMIAETPAAPENVAPIDRRLDGWETADHMALGQWRDARKNSWRTLSASHNSLGEDERRQALWDHLTGYRPRVARFLAQHEPEGVPLEVAA